MTRRLAGFAWAALLCPAALAAQADRAAEHDRDLPVGDVFRPLLADPKQPQFFASYLHATSSVLTGWVSNVGLGESVGLWRANGGTSQVSLVVGVMSQFDMNTPSNDLINTDFTGGLAYTARRGTWSGRLRIYHQSSHLGDEWVLGHQSARINLSFEALDVLVAREVGALRLYGGGEYLLRRDPPQLKPAVLHGGAEWRSPRLLVSLGRFGNGRPIAALDLKAAEERSWTPGAAATAGIEFGSARRWSIQLHGYHGPSPYGQFYDEEVTAWGLGVHLSL